MYKILAAVEDNYFVDEMEAFLARLALPEDTEIMLLHAIEPLEAVSAWPSEQYRKDAQFILDEIAIRMRARFPSATVTTNLREGYPGEEIIDVSFKEGVNLILVGSHGRRGINRLVFGSVSATVAAVAPCPTVIVRKIQTTKTPVLSARAAEQAK